MRTDKPKHEEGPVWNPDERFHSPPVFKGFETALWGTVQGATEPTVTPYKTSEHCACKGHARTLYFFRTFQPTVVVQLIYLFLLK